MGKKKKKTKSSKTQARHRRSKKAEPSPALPLLQDLVKLAESGKLAALTVIWSDGERMNSQLFCNQGRAIHMLGMMVDTQDRLLQGYREAEG